MRRLWFYLSFLWNFNNYYYIFQYKYSFEYNARLLRCMSEGIKSVIHDPHVIQIIFNDGSSARLWDSNKYYAWLTGQGSIISGGYTYQIRNETRPAIYTRDLLKSQLRRFKKGLHTGSRPLKVVEYENVTVRTVPSYLDEVF